MKYIRNQIHINKVQMYIRNQIHNKGKVFPKGKRCNIMIYNEVETKLYKFQIDWWQYLNLYSNTLYMFSFLSIVPYISIKKKSVKHKPHVITNKSMTTESHTFFWSTCFFHTLHLRTDQVLLKLSISIKHLGEIPYSDHSHNGFLINVPSLKYGKR